MMNPRQYFQKNSVLVFFFFLAFYLFTNAGDYKIGDETFMTATAKSIVYRSRIGLNLANEPDETYGIVKQDGLFYSKYGLGQSLVEVPFYAAHRGLVHALDLKMRPQIAYPLEVLLAHLCPSTFSALGCMLVFLLSIQLGLSRRIALINAMLYGICTMAWPYAKTLMADTTLNVAVLGGVYAAVRYRNNHERHVLILAGFFLGLALITKITSVILLPFVIVYMCWGDKKGTALRDVITCFLPVFMIFAGIQLWHNMIRYDDPFQFGYAYGRDRLGFQTPLFVGLWGYLFSPGKSFFLYSPITILGILAYPAFLKRNRREGVLFLSLILVFTIFHARWWSWTGDLAWGPRFLLVITPYLLLPCGVFLTRWNFLSKSAKYASIALALVSLYVQIIGVTVHPFAFTEPRGIVVSKLVREDYQDLESYAWSANEYAYTAFTPNFSHIAGNAWLFKHIWTDYDIWSDAPWKNIGSFNLPRLPWTIGDRVIPFWWPVSMPIQHPGSGRWVYALAAAIFLSVCWFGIRLRRCFKTPDRRPTSGLRSK